MKIKALILSLSLSMAASAEIDLRFNFQGNFVPPDKVLLDRGVEAYRDGNLNSAKDHFKRSAKFGNDLSKYMTALLYFEDKDLVNGLAWLKLLRNPVQDSEELTKKIEGVMTKGELQAATTRLRTLMADYDDEAVFKRRDKWQKKIKFTGTNIPGFRTVAASKNLTVSPGNTVGHLANSGSVVGTNSDINASFGPIARADQLRQTLINYVYEYVPAGDVRLGDIEEKNN